MKKIERRAFVCLALALLLAAGLGVFLVRYFLDGGSWASSAFNRHLYNSSGELASGTVLDRDGDVLSEIVDGRRTYYDNATVRRATLHAVGDLQGNIGTGALNAFADKLTGYSLLNGAFGAQRGNDLYLTIDARYNYTAYEALGGHAGTVAVYNYKTGEILCMVSAPSYDPLNVPEDIETSDRYEGAYLNRFLSSAFTPGSVYKTVTLTAALEEIPDLMEWTWTCEGSVQIGDETIVCSGTHGEQDIAAAFANSCNVAFALLAQELGADTLEKYTEQAGLTDSYSISGLPTARGSFDFDGITDGQLGWAGVGQYHDQVNPAALMVYMGAVANGGKAAEPYLMASIQKGEKTTYTAKRSSTGRILEEATAKKLTEMMRYNVENIYGAWQFGDLNVCAKSGTAEQEGQVANAMFAGFVQDADCPLAFVVFIENGGSGSAAAAPVAAQVLKACAAEIKK